MNLSILPNQIPDIVTAIDQAKKKGPSALAELAMLCLWLVGQRKDPRQVYSGPDGLKPLDHLLMVIEQVRDRSEPEFVTFSDLIDLTRLFPKPVSTIRQRESEAGAKQQVKSVLSEAKQQQNAGRRLFLWCQGLSQLAQSGIGSAHLQPLIRLIIDNWSVKADILGDAPKALLYAGELQQAKKMLEAIPVSAHLGAAIRSDCARILVEINQFDEARHILDRLWAERDHFYPGRLDGERTRIAEVYAYLGDSVTARDLIGTAYLESRILIECLIVWNRHASGQAFDLSEVLKLAWETDQIHPLKSRAHEQIGILRLLLTVGAYESAWQVLTLLQETLLKIELWGKLEFRTNDAAAVLWPYLDQHPSPIFLFVSGLLVAKAMDTGDTGGVWPMVHVVSGLSFPIRHWAGKDEVQRLTDFLRSWRDKTV